MSNVAHAEDWSKLAELLPQLEREYRKHAGRSSMLLSFVALLPPLLIPLEAVKWYSHNPGLLAAFAAAYILLASSIFFFTGRWVGNVRNFGVARIRSEGLLQRTLDRIERDAGKSDQMSFEEIYLTDGSGLERRTRKHIVYAENDIELNMDRGQKLFANNNIPLMINTIVVALYCAYTIIGGFFLPYDEVKRQDVLIMVQAAILLCLPIAIFLIQSHLRQHLLNQVLSGELQLYITDDDAREAAELAFVEAQAQAQRSAEASPRDEDSAAEESLSENSAQGSPDEGEDGVQVRA